MKQIKVFSKSKNKGFRTLTLILATIIATTFVGCSSDNSTVEEASTDNTSTVAATVVETKSDELVDDAVDAGTEEATVEDTQFNEDTSHLSNEEWVKSLNVETATFLVFNEITGERKVLENNQEYVLVEGDEIGITRPKKARLLVSEETPIYSDTEIKNGCLVFYIDFDLITEKTEFTRKCKTEAGEIQTVTVYLSK